MTATDWLYGSFKKSVRLALIVGIVLLALAFLGAALVFALVCFIVALLVIAFFNFYTNWQIKRKLRESNVDSNNS